MTFTNAISWFEIPATELERATRFYEAIFEIAMIPLEMEDMKMSMFPVEDMMTGIGGAIVQAPAFYKSSETDGVLIYLNGNPDLQLVLDRVEKAGGKIAQPKTLISPDYGFMALIIDTEGNRIGLHNVQQ